jgi:hypothetical protein
MSPEEIMWDNGGSAGAAEPFEVRGGPGTLAPGCLPEALAAEAPPPFF